MTWVNSRSGNALIIASTTAIILGLTWGGIKYPWDAYQVLCPLVLGIVGLGFALLYEIRWATQPTVRIADNGWLYAHIY